MRQISITHFDRLDYNCNEALNTLCTNLTFTNARSIMFTSCQPNEGKSFLCMNVMRTLASMGKTVVHVDCDLRKSVLSGRYGLRMPPNAFGLSNYLAMQCPKDEILYETSVLGAYMVPSGHEVINSMQLLSGPSFSELMKELKRTFDFVVVDAPPVGLIIDAAIIAKNCDGTVLVMQDQQVHRRELLEAKQQVEKSGCPVLGVVINKVNYTSNSYYQNHVYKKYYNHYYGSEEKTNRRSGTRK